MEDFDSWIVEIIDNDAKSSLYIPTIHGRVIFIETEYIT